MAMNGRWSDGSTSGANTGHRFVCWNSADDFDHTQLIANWDTLHFIIGGPEAWPTNRGVAGGIYQSLANIIADLVPVGAVIAWAPPSTTSTSIPAGWAPCDGRVIAIGQHDFGGGTYTTPDLRNRFVLGSGAPDAGAPVIGTLNPTYTYAGDGQANAAGNDPLNAPGVNALGGANLSVHQHSIAHHYHSHPHIHEASGSTDDSTNENTAAKNTNVGTLDSLAHYGHVHAVDFMTSGTRPPGSSRGSSIGQNHTSIPVFNQNATTPVSTDSPNSATNPTGGTNIDGNGNVSDNGLMYTNAPDFVQQDLRPNWYGLLYLVKVKRQATAP